MESCCLLHSQGGGGGSDSWAGTPDPLRRMQKVEWEHQVPSCALQMSGISLNDIKCQTLSHLLKFVCWAEQPFIRSSTDKGDGVPAAGPDPCLCCHTLEDYKKEGERLLTWAGSDRRRGKGFKLKEERLRLDIRRKFLAVRVLKLWQRLPREI